MNKDCQLVVFSDKAYNAIIRETFEWEPVETGGILLGHVLDNGCWIVMEVLPPGYGEGREGNNVYHEYGYFEYNQKFVNYLAKSVAEQYKIPLELLGLWHRHPGSMDHFSGTDDGTNSTFAAQNPHGVISGLINVDPQLRMTMYYLAHSDARNFGHLNYQKVNIEVGSDLIPDEYFKLRYYKGTEHDLHPYAPQKAGCPNGDSQQVDNAIVQETQSSDGQKTDEFINVTNIIRDQINGKDKSHGTQAEPTLSVAEDIIEKIKKNKIAIILFLAIIAFLFSLSSIKNDFSKGFHFFEGEKKQSESVNTIGDTNYDANGNAKDKSVISKEDESVIEQKNNPVNENATNTTFTESKSDKSAKETDNSKEVPKIGAQTKDKK